MAIPRTVRKSGRGPRGAATKAANSAKPQKSPLRHIDTTSSPQGRRRRVKAEPVRAQRGSFRETNDAHDSESDEDSPHLSSASTTGDDSGDEELRNPTSASDHHIYGLHNKERHIRILSIAESETITIEELSTEDMFDFNNVLKPSRIQDASSDDSDMSDTDSRSSLADDFENLQCGPELTEEDFEKCCKRRWYQNRKRWKKGGNHKRHHDQTVGSGEEFEDVIPLDPPVSNPYRRLRRRTGEPREKPERSQIIGSVEELFGTVSNVILETNVSGDYDEYLLSQWTFDSMVIDEDDPGEDDASEKDKAPTSDDDSSEEDASDEESSDDDSTDSDEE
jgi:hypothetical protein